MKQEYRMNSIEKFFYLIESTMILIVLGAIAIDSVCHITWPLKTLIIREVVLFCGLLIVFFCAMQTISSIRPRCLDLDQIMDNFDLVIDYGILDDIAEDSSQNGKFLEYDIVREDENRTIFATFIVDRKDGEVIGLLVPYIEDNIIRLEKFAPSPGLHPTLVIDTEDDDIPDIVIAEDLALLLVRAMRNSDARNVDDSQDTVYKYMLENCYGLAMHQRFYSWRRSNQIIPTSHGEDEEVSEEPRI